MDLKNLLEMAWAVRNAETPNELIHHRAWALAYSLGEAKANEVSDVYDYYHTLIWNASTYRELEFNSHHRALPAFLMKCAA